jgi:hypothetical protein
MVISPTTSQEWRSLARFCISCRRLKFANRSLAKYRSMAFAKSAGSSAPRHRAGLAVYDLFFERADVIRETREAEAVVLISRAS